MLQEEVLLNIETAILCIKKGDILLSFINGKKSYFALKKDKVFIQNASSTFSLSLNEFQTLYQEAKFLVYDPSKEVEIDSLKDEEYYSWNVLKY